MKRYIIILGFIMPIFAVADINYEVKNYVIFLEDSTTYSVQIGAFKKARSDDFFLGLDNVVLHPKKDGLVRYTVGSFIEFKEAIDCQRKMQERGFKDAFIVSFKSDKRTIYETPVNTDNKSIKKIQKVEVIDSWNIILTEESDSLVLLSQKKLDVSKIESPLTIEIKNDTLEIDSQPFKETENVENTVIMETILTDTLVKEDESNSNNIKLKLELFPVIDSIQKIKKNQKMELNRYSIGLNIGTVYDIASSELDVDQWSSDLSSNLSDKICFSYLLSLNYKISSDLSLLIDYGSGSIYGKNEIMYYDGQFSQYNISSTLNILSITNSTKLYAKVGLGVIKSKAKRRFIYDDIVFLENKNESLKSEIGLGINQKVSDRWDVNLEAVFNRVDDDGFDTWDDGTGNDKFLYTSIGIKYRLGKKQLQEGQYRTYDEWLEKFKAIDDCIDCDEVERRLDSLERLFNLVNLNEEKLDELQKQRLQIAAQYLPLNLYFHNDEPDPFSISTSTKKTYKEVYISYYKMKDEYNKYNPNLESFFEDSLIGNFNKLNILLSHILSDLSEGKKIQLQIKGYASPLHEKQYNINLSQRRIKSFINYVELHKGREFSPYLTNGHFQIIELPYGENNADNSVSDDPKNKQKSVFSLDAMLERKIEIIDVKLVQ